MLLAPASIKGVLLVGEGEITIDLEGEDRSDVDGSGRAESMLADRIVVFTRLEIIERLFAEQSCEEKNE